MSSIASASVLPLFAVASHIPEDTNVYTLCLAAERESGPRSVDGATCISGLWRIYPLIHVARETLLANGIEIGGRRLTLEASNPFQQQDGSEVPATRLTVSNLPLSYSNNDVLSNLTQMGVQPRSRVTMEKARRPDGSLSNWKTGRRMVWINLPARPLPRSTRIGNFLAFLYYREMREAENTGQLRQEKAREASDYSREEVCSTCNKPGHRLGDTEGGSSVPARQKDGGKDKEEAESTDEAESDDDSEEEYDGDSEQEEDETNPSRPTGKKEAVRGPESKKRDGTTTNGTTISQSSSSKTSGNVRNNGNGEKLREPVKNDTNKTPKHSESSTPSGPERPTRSIQSELTKYLSQDSSQDGRTKEAVKRATPSTSPDVGSQGNPQQKARLK